MTLRLTGLRALAVAVLVGGLALAGGAQAQTLAGPELAAALKEGGLVVVMRHASSPREQPDEATANADNPERERQLDQAGLAAAEAMGAVIDALGIPIGVVHSSPTYRARQTVRAAGLGEPQIAPELDLPGGMADGPDALAPGAAWLRAKAAEPPPARTNVLLVTHGPNLAAAFGEEAPDVADGEALMFRPDDAGGATLVARVKIEDWPVLAIGR